LSPRINFAWRRNDSSAETFNHEISSLGGGTQGRSGYEASQTNCCGFI
jgi:hypothetical protein